MKKKMSLEIKGNVDLRYVCVCMSVCIPVCMSVCMCVCHSSLSYSHFKSEEMIFGPDRKVSRKKSGNRVQRAAAGILKLAEHV